MRAIDADALIEFCAERWIPLNIDAVNMQPTIQPVATDTNVGNNSEIPNSSDAVSRQAVLDAIVQCTNCGDEDTLRGYVLKHSLDNGWTGGILEALDAVKDLPPAQPEVLACGNGELVANPEPTDIDAKEAVYNLAEKIGIHQLFALTVELRGEPIQPEPHEGHWIKHETPDGGEQYECSRCGVLWEFTDGTPEDNEAYFCPKCGARMTR